MVATTMLDSGYRACFDIIDVLLMGVATFQPNLVKIDPNMNERPQFFEIQDGGIRHLEVRQLGAH